jgi:hypothetical protein
MEKQLLRDIINNKIKSEDKIKLKLFGEPELELTVSEIKIGRGKGGLARVVLTKENVEFGTSDSEKIVSITIGTEQFGTGEELEFDPKHLIKNEDKGRLLKAQLSPLLKTNIEGIKIKLTSSWMPTFNGTYNLVKVFSIKGRYGQTVIRLEDPETKFQFEVFSHRHATILNNIEIIKT